MKQDVIKFDNHIYQIDVFMENKPGRMSCYYIDSSNPILIEVGPSKSFPYLISSLESLGINEINRSAMTHLHLDHVGGIGHLVEKFKDHFVVVGAGFIACEFACILKGLGVEVTQLVRSHCILKGFDSELSTALVEAMGMKGIDLCFGESVSSIKGKPGFLKISTNLGRTIDSNGLLFATGREPFLQGLKLEDIGLKTNDNKIKVDKKNKTNISNIFAVGDCAVINNNFRPPSGVWAVRAALPLSKNLERFSRGLRLIQCLKCISSCITLFY